MADPVRPCKCLPQSRGLTSRQRQQTCHFGFPLKRNPGEVENCCSRVAVPDEGGDALAHWNASASHNQGDVRPERAAPLPTMPF
jgi:hypothetical protein